MPRLTGFALAAGTVISLDHYMPYTPPPNIQSLDLTALSQLISGQSRPPVEKWHPDAQSDSHMRIARDGRWYHRGDEITRPAMIKLFASILRREDDGRYALVTPYEKQFIAVDAVPFIAVELSAMRGDNGDILTFRLNTDELVIAGPDNLLRAEGAAEDPRFFLHVRPGLEAALSRTVHYDLITLMLEQGGTAPAFTLNYNGAKLMLDRPCAEDAAK